jgi:uncharacterized protein
MKIKVNSLPNGIHDFVLTKSVKEYDLEEPFYGDIRAAVRVDKSNGQIIFDCSFNVVARLQCDRCLELYDEKLSGEFRIIYMADTVTEEDEKNDIYQLTPETVYVDLTKDFFDYVKLALPMKRLCSEDCKGLCPTCGANLNYETCNCKTETVNPVWEPLLKLKNNNELK